jgi:H/ACA ribonucleoprotein complex subunit 2
LTDPLAQKKLSKKVFKTIKKATKTRGHVKRGVKEVVKGLRKGDKGLVILAGDISPMDILSHIPVLCEDTDNPYIFVSSKDALGAASSTKRPTSCVMIVPGGGKKGAQKTASTGDASKEEYADEYKSIHAEVKALGENLLLS